MLNCGLRIPPVAGSGSGANDNPVGTNRVYVYCGNEFSTEAWWEGLEAGRVFVTNGPLLRPIVEGQPPGYVFHLDGGESLTLEIGLNLATRVPVEYLQIIKNGAVEAEVRLADWKDKKGRLPPVDVRRQRLVPGAGRHQQPARPTSSPPAARITSRRPTGRASAAGACSSSSIGSTRPRPASAKLPKLDDAERDSHASRARIGPRILREAAGNRQRRVTARWLLHRS